MDAVLHRLHLLEDLAPLFQLPRRPGTVPAVRVFIRGPAFLNVIPRSPGVSVIVDGRLVMLVQT